MVCRGCEKVVKWFEKEEKALGLFRKKEKKMRVDG